MAESNSETRVQHEKGLEILTEDFEGQDDQDDLLDLKMGASIVATVLAENVTKEKTKILKLKQEIQDLKNKEIELDLFYAWAKQAISNRIDLKNNNDHLWVTPAELCSTFPEDKLYAILAPEPFPIEKQLPGASEKKSNFKLVLKPKKPIEVILVNQYPETNKTVDDSAKLLQSCTFTTDASEDKSNENEDITEHEDENEAVGEETEDKYGDMEEDASKDNDKSKVTSDTDPTEQEEKSEDVEDKADEVMEEDYLNEVALLNESRETNDLNVISAPVAVSANLPPSSTRNDASEDKSNENEDTTEHEDENEAVGEETEDKYGDMEEDASKDNDKSKVTSDTDPTEQEEKSEDVGDKADEVMEEDYLNEVALLNESRETNDLNVISAPVAVSANLPPPSTKAQDKDAAMQKDDLDGNNKFKVTTAQPKKQSLNRKAAQRQLFIQQRHYDIVKNKKNNIIKRKASPKEILTVRGSGKEKEKVSSESTSAVSISKAKDDVSAEKENEKEVQEKAITKSRGKILGLNQQTNTTKSQNTENHPVKKRVNTRASKQDEVTFQYHDKMANVLQSLDKLCSLPSPRDYFFQLDKSEGAVDLFEITDPNIDLKCDEPNVTDNFARPRIMRRPEFEAFLKREMCDSGKEAAKEAQIKYRCPYCFMLSLSRDNIKNHIQSRKEDGKWRRPSCLPRRLKEPNINGIYESKWPDPKRNPIIEIDCNLIAIWIHSQLDIRIPGNCCREKKAQNLFV